MQLHQLVLQRARLRLGRRVSHSRWQFQLVRPQCLQLPAVLADPPRGLAEHRRAASSLAGVCGRRCHVLDAVALRQRELCQRSAMPQRYWLHWAVCLRRACLRAATGRRLRRECAVRSWCRVRGRALQRVMFGRVVDLVDHGQPELPVQRHCHHFCRILVERVRRHLPEHPGLLSLLYFAS